MYLWITFFAAAGVVCYYNNNNMQTRIFGKIIKVGSSLAVVIPVDILNGMKIYRGDYVSFAVFADNQILLKKISAEKIQELKPQKKNDL